MRLIKKTTDPWVIIAALTGVLESLRIYLEHHPAVKVIDQVLEDLENLQDS